MSDTDSKNLADVVYLKGSGYGSAYEVVINRGSEHSVKPGDTYLIFGYGEEITDPKSQLSLGRLEEVRGRGKVIHVQDKISTIRSINKDSNPGKRIIRKSSGIHNFGTTEETEIPESVDRPFDGVKVGDIARLIN
jgi:hypothetical protein